MSVFWFSSEFAMPGHLLTYQKESVNFSEMQISGSFFFNLAQVLWDLEFKF